MSAVQPRAIEHRPPTTYEAVIGLECHVQLATASKLFCGCPTDYAGAPPNTHVCPVCLGMPGVLPVINRRAVDFTILTGLALGATIPPATKFDRKNYPYPDLVKGYQISQYDLPLVAGGEIEVAGDGAMRRVRFERIHLEEDTGKLTHADGGGSGSRADAGSVVDFNRSGVPLMELVTRPDLRTPAEARAFLHTLRTILRTLGVSTADMEKGQLRCDVNVSLRPVGQASLGTKVEVKNLNSFRSVFRALEFEIARQAALLDRGERIPQETRGWLEERGVTVLQRTKEEAHDYRYFPEPDLPPLFIGRDWVARLQATLPELPDARRDRYVAQLKLGAYDAELLAGDAWTATYFEAALQAGADPKKAANLILNDLARLRAESGEDGRLAPAGLAELIGLVDAGTLSSSAARQVLDAAFRTGGAPAALVEELGLGQLSDAAALDAAVRAAMEAHPAAVADYRAGKAGALNFLKGQVMRATRGKANPAVAEALLKQHLG